MELFFTSTTTRATKNPMHRKARSTITIMRAMMIVWEVLAAGPLVGGSVVGAVLVVGNIIPGENGLLEVLHACTHTHTHTHTDAHTYTYNSLILLDSGE